MSAQYGESGEEKISGHGSSEQERGPSGRLRLGVLISGSGSNLQAIIDALEAGDLPGVEIALVMSNNASAEGIQRALRHRLPVLYLPWGKFPADAFPGQMTPNETLLARQLELFQVDLVVLAGWMRILRASFLELFARRVINIHPALLPPAGEGAFYTLASGQQIPVFRGLHAVRMALDAGVTTTGSSVHYVTPAVDAGPVICQREVPIEPGDSEERLHERLKAVEHQLIVQAIRDWR